ncbi:MAG: HugZ family protein [Gammaproteobacteria bacterium]
MSTANIGAEARRLLLRGYHGVLSTLSVEAPGYPFGSVVPYCLDRRGWPVILISRIAQHTKNIQADPKVSLIVQEDGVQDIQAAARLTCLANAEPIAEGDTDTPARYYRYYPQARGYHQTHDFEFYRLALMRARYIGGFGRIHWLEPGQLVRPNPFSSGQERSMVQHMNDDHQEAMARYCKSQGIPVPADGKPAMAGIDGEGFHLLLGTRIVRFDFDRAVTTPLEVRAKLVTMARADG